tara:strand:+ start:470 stop:721 length:252 start_codon:yes stop_codon:yes gene_type:complete
MGAIFTVDVDDNLDCVDSEKELTEDDERTTDRGGFRQAATGQKEKEKINNLESDKKCDLEKKKQKQFRSVVEASNRTKRYSTS